MSSRYKKGNGKTIYLVDPTNVVSTISTLHYNIPKKLLGIHAFHADRDKVIEVNNKANLLSQGFYGSTKEKLVKKQKGICPVCEENLRTKVGNFDNLHIHHIIPISMKGKKHLIRNMILVHKWCHKDIHRTLRSQHDKSSLK